MLQSFSPFLDSNESVMEAGEHPENIKKPVD